MTSLRQRVFGIFGGVLFLWGCETLDAPDPAKAPKKSKTSEIEVWSDGRGGVWYYHPQKLDWHRADAVCKTIAKKTKSRWRLPNPEELKDAVGHGISSSKNKSFGWRYLGNTWTVNWENNFNILTGVYINMDHSKLYRTTMDHKFTTICVKTDTGKTNSTWVDKKTGMVWRYYPKRGSWDTAKKVCQSYGKNERLPWRTPKRDELDQAVTHGIQSTANLAFGREYLSHTWAQEIEPTYPDEAYAVDLRNEDQYLFPKSEDLSILCVRPLAH